MVDVVNPQSVPSQDYMAQQVTNPALPAGGEQTYTPQAVDHNDLINETIGQISKQPAQTAAQVDPNSAQVDPNAVQAQPAAQVTATQGVAQQGVVTPESTIKGQLTSLMSDVDSGNAPWASAAIRKANDAMAQRGLGQSSMAGAAISQSILEAAIPIAQYDAGVYGQMNLENLRARQETMISNTAAVNAASNLNAQSVNDVNKFMAGLKSDILKFNANQKAAMDQFNAGATNSMQEFYAQIDDQADKFNATNALTVATSNAEWRRSINTANTAGINAANMVNAQNEFNISQQAMANLWQRSRDILNNTNAAAENERDRAFKLTEYAMQRSDYLHDLSAAQKSDLSNSVGNLIYNMFSNQIFGDG